MTFEMKGGMVGGSSASWVRVLSSLRRRVTSFVDEAHIEDWMNYASTDLEIPIEALIVASATTPAPEIEALRADVRADLRNALAVLHRHLSVRTYLVGDTVTSADLTLARLLRRAVVTKLWDPDEGPDQEHVRRWYHTVTHQVCFARAVDVWHSIRNRVVHWSSSALPPQLYQRRRVRIRDVIGSEVGLANHWDRTIVVCGWTRSIRTADRGRLCFVELNDGSSHQSLQCICDARTTQGYDQTAVSVNGGTGASFRFVGTLVASPASDQRVELRVSEATLFGAVHEGAGGQVGGQYYPLSPKAHTLEHVRKHAHLRPRTRLHAAAMRIRHALAVTTHRFFHDRGFVYVHTPLLTGSDCEGAGEQFTVTTLLPDPTQTNMTLPTIPSETKEAPGDDGEEKLSKQEQKRRAKRAAKEAAKAELAPPEAQARTDPRIPGRWITVKIFLASRSI